ncbi:hypothetical protein NDU88_000230 [Pleurodeles waltl]|uniref:Uncharacterized protein n=1 Tax=Pleurodeles waltl TaxID=8319 RepID=A0AAV7Q0P9_PLEWA|nr:hypothetical protein NDU88_000230 [Pleurodeles waltl]
MTEWLPFEEEEFGQGYEEALGPQLGEGLSEVINASVQQSRSRALAVSVPQKINQAVLAALQTLTQQFECFVKKQGLVPLTDDKLTDEGPSVAAKPKPQTTSWPHDGAMSALTQSSSDHVYCSLPSSSKGSPLDAEVSSVSDSAASDSSHSCSSLRKLKRTRKSVSSHAKERPKSPSSPFQFNPEDIINPRSADWAQTQAMADYLHDKLRNGFDKEVQSRPHGGRGYEAEDGARLIRLLRRGRNFSCYPGPPPGANCQGAGAETRVGDPSAGGARSEPDRARRKRPASPRPGAGLRAGAGNRGERVSRRVAGHATARCVRRSRSTAAWKARRSPPARSLLVSGGAPAGLIEERAGSLGRKTSCSRGRERLTMAWAAGGPSAPFLPS